MMCVFPFLNFSLFDFFFFGLFDTKMSISLNCEHLNIKWLKWREKNSHCSIVCRKKSTQIKMVSQSFWLACEEKKRNLLNFDHITTSTILCTTVTLWENVCLSNQFYCFCSSINRMGKWPNNLLNNLPFVTSGFEFESLCIFCRKMLHTKIWNEKKTVLLWRFLLNSDTRTRIRTRKYACETGKNDEKSLEEPTIHCLVYFRGSRKHSSLQTHFEMPIMCSSFYIK